MGPQPDAQGNYASPALERIRCVWVAYQTEQATAEDVTGILQQVAGFLQVELATLTAQVEQGISRPDDPIFQQIQRAFQQHLEAIDVMLEGSEFETGLAQAQAATNLLMQAHGQAMEHVEAMGQVSCIFCQRSNPRDNDRCANCGRNLPDAPGKSSFAAVNAEGLENAGSSGSEVTENFVLVAEALLAWRREEINADTLLSTLEEVEHKTLLYQAETMQFRDMIGLAREDAQEALHHGVDLTQAGLTEMLTALDKMKLAFLKEDDSYLETGIQDLERAAQALARAYHAARAAAAAA